MAQIISQVTSSSVGINRLVLQSVCRANGVRAIRPVWEQKIDGKWVAQRGMPEFTARFWVEAISKAAKSGMLGSQNYKDLVVSLAQGLSSEKPTSPKAYINIVGSLILVYPIEMSSSVDEFHLLDKLSVNGREVTCRANEAGEGSWSIEFQVSENLHFTEALSKLPEELRELVKTTNFEQVCIDHPETSFTSFFGEIDLKKESPLIVDYKVSVQ